MAVEALDPHAREYDALLVVSFGGPEGPDDVLPFLDNVFRGLRVTPETKTHIAKRYARFGGVSPINDHTRALIKALQQAGKSFEVQVTPDAGHSGVNNQRMMEFFIENLIMHPERLMAPSAGQ